MINKVKKVSTKCLLVLSLIFAATACDKHLEVENSPGSNGIELSNIGDIKKDYEAKLNKSNGFRGGQKRKEKIKGKILKWDKSYTIKKGNEQKIVVPFKLKDEIYTKLADSTLAAYSDIATFIVSGKKGEYTYEIATKFPDAEWLNDQSKPFSGKIIVEDINGNFVKGYRYKGNEIIPLTVSESGAGQRTTAFVMICDVTDWYTCSYTGGQLIGCEWDREELTNCEVEYDDWKQDKFSVYEDGTWYPNFTSCVGCGSGKTTSSLKNPNLFIMTYEQQAAYPRLTVMVKSLYEYVKANADVMFILKTLTGLSDATILDKMQWGKGPTINVVDMTGRFGYFNANNPSVLNIDASWVRGLEQANLVSTQEATGFLLAVTVLHEFVHYGRNAAGEPANPGGVEYGFSFEQSAYGVFITPENASKYSYKFYKKP
jgi:hypothetical protein